MSVILLVLKRAGPKLERMEAQRKRIADQLAEVEAQIAELSGGGMPKVKGRPKRKPGRQPAKAAAVKPAQSPGRPAKAKPAAKPGLSEARLAGLAKARAARAAKRRAAARGEA